MSDERAEVLDAARRGLLIVASNPERERVILQLCAEGVLEPAIGERHINPRLVYRRKRLV